jgi:hypothetical protein
MKKYLIIIISILIIIFSILFFLKPHYKFENPMTQIKINNQVFKVDIVNSQKDIEKGLCGRKSLDENFGMLFEFPDTDFRTFWMKDMNFDLDILFIENNTIKEIKTLQKPTSAYIPFHRSKEKANSVLEINAGLCEKFRIKVGDKIVVGSEL